MPTIKNGQSPTTVWKQAVPLLGYYEIFKQYYANKQEENAYVITPDEKGTVKFAIVQITHDGGTTNTQGVTNTTPPWGTVKLTLKGTDKTIYLGGDNIAKNNEDDVFIKLRDAWYGKKEYKATEFGWYRDWETHHLQDRKSTRLNSSHSAKSRMPSSA